MSRKYGWYLAKITASIENFKNIVATSLETINKYNLTPGNYIKISSLLQTHPKKRFLDKFILLPYYKELIQNYWLLQGVIQSLTNATYRYVDKEYAGEIIRLMNSFFPVKNSKKHLKLKEILEFEQEGKEQMSIAIPESWLNEHSVDLGEIVLLRDDLPSSVII